MKLTWTSYYTSRLLLIKDMNKQNQFQLHEQAKSSLVFPCFWDEKAKSIETGEGQKGSEQRMWKTLSRDISILKRGMNI